MSSNKFSIHFLPAPFFPPSQYFSFPFLPTSQFFIFIYRNLSVHLELMKHCTQTTNRMEWAFFLDQFPFAFLCNARCSSEMLNKLFSLTRSCHGEPRNRSNNIEFWTNCSLNALDVDKLICTKRDFEEIYANASNSRNLCFSCRCDVNLGGLY